MDAFSYLSVLTSIILGLGIQQVLQGYRALILSRKRVTFYAPPLIWSVLLLAMIAQHWWASFSLASRAEWSFGIFATVLVMTALIYMLAAIVLPISRPTSRSTSRIIITARLRPSSGSRSASWAGACSGNIAGGAAAGAAQPLFHGIFASTA